jgi:hypothetical protein
MTFQGIHICTSDSLLAGAPEVEGFCLVCCRPGMKLQVGYTITHCAGCDKRYNPDGFCEVVMLRRKLLGLSSKEMALKLGLARKTISKYETTWPSKTYWEKTRELMEERNRQCQQK